MTHTEHRTCVLSPSDGLVQTRPARCCDRQSTRGCLLAAALAVGSDTAVLVGAEGRITSQHPLSLSLLTCPTCLQSTVALSFGPHRRALRGCGRESHIQRATEKQGRQIGTRDVLRRQLCWFVRPLTANISGKIGG